MSVEHTDREIIDEAERALRELEPRRVERYDPEGRRIS